MDARLHLLDIVARVRRDLAAAGEVEPTTFVFESETPGGPWYPRYWGSQAVSEIVVPAVLELGTVVLAAIDSMPLAIQARARQYQHDPAAAWSRVVLALIRPTGELFGSPEPFCGLRQFAFTRFETVTAHHSKKARSKDLAFFVF